MDHAGGAHPMVYRVSGIFMTKAGEIRQRTILAEAYQNYEGRLCSYAFSKVNDRALSEDLVQETFIKTWEYLAKGKNVELMKAFLYHVLNSLVVDEYRKHKAASLDVLLEKGHEPTAGCPDRTVAVLDGKAAIHLIQKLPQKYREVVYMRYVQELSLGEMACLTGQSKNAVAVQVHRGLRKLKLLHESA